MRIITLCRCIAGPSLFTLSYRHLMQLSDNFNSFPELISVNVSFLIGFLFPSCYDPLKSRLAHMVCVDTGCTHVLFWFPRNVMRSSNNHPGRMTTKRKEEEFIKRGGNVENETIVFYDTLTITYLLGCPLILPQLDSHNIRMHNCALHLES